MGAFTGMLSSFEHAVTSDPAALHAATQKLGQDLVNFYAAENQRLAEQFAQRAVEQNQQAWADTTAAWGQTFREDPDIGLNRQNTTLSRVGQVLEQYGREMGPEKEAAVREAFDLTGGGYHPEIIRLMNWAANRFVEKARPVPAIVPKPPNSTDSRASRLYRNSTRAA